MARGKSCRKVPAIFWRAHLKVLEMRQLCVNSKVLFFGQLAQVTINVHSSIVNLQGKNCSCTEFQENSIACKHAVCAIDKRREPIMDYVHPAYLTRNLNAKKAIKH